ncbi:lipopolysaccharide transport periplasmic protein LptA [bacterium]|nr:lipopolysaccharide transport periplasmic protein LptA [bacterium]
MRVIRRAAFVLLALGLGTASQAQGTNVAFAGLKTDTTQPVQVTADQLSVNQNDGTALFTGNVVVKQGAMTLQAATVRIEYAKDKKTISHMFADGGVKLASDTDAASAQSADYAPETGDILMTGDVVMTQGAAAMSGQKLTLSLKTGLGTMDGRVTTTFTPTQAPKN